MENKKSFLKLSSVPVPGTKLSVRIPSVGEILDDEGAYYSIVSALTASPFQYMVPLDDMGMDYTTVTDYELFKILFAMCVGSDLSILFGDLDLSDLTRWGEPGPAEYLYSPGNDIAIDEKAYHSLAEIVRKINLLEKVTCKPGNDSARKYLLEKERRKRKRQSQRPYEPYLEKLVIALVNTSEFPYDYDACMDLSIYRFHQSLRQIQNKISFDNAMIGVYAGTVDTSRLGSKDLLSWIPE